ncbi:Pentatricopeptide repeat-containing protein [Nymphaea thermarum]|nr:Pentatricopeptide repeat-containing protein [Nymphaea thermarum]
MMRPVFERISPKDVVSRNSMLKGYSKCGRHDEFVELFKIMEKALVENEYIEAALELIQQMLGASLKPDLVSWTTIIEGYVNSGKFDIL